MQEEKGRMMLVKIDHIAINVFNIEKAEKFYVEKLGLELKEVEIVDPAKVKVAFMPIGDTDVELVAPSSKDSPLNKSLKTKGPCIDHICFEVDDLDEVIKSLSSKGVKLVNEKPKPGARNTRIVFLDPASCGGISIELAEKIRD